MYASQEQFCPPAPEKSSGHCLAGGPGHLPIILARDSSVRLHDLIDEEQPPRSRAPGLSLPYSHGYLCISITVVTVSQCTVSSILRSW